MKTLIALIGGFILAALIILLLAKFGGGNQKKVAGFTIGDPQAPKIEMPEKKYDFGKINLSDVAKHDFQITNTGQSPLIISGIITSCHCTSAVLKIAGQKDSPEFGMHTQAGWSTEVAPGGEADLEVIYKPQVMPVKGYVSRVITFSTNDPANKEIQVEITTEVL